MAPRRSSSIIPAGIGRDGWLVLAVTMAAIAMLLSLLAVGFGIRAIEQGHGAGVRSGRAPAHEGEKLLARPGVFPYETAQR